MIIKKRCDWTKGNKLMEEYHDSEWGIPTFDDQKIFEFLVLESMQAGLSWQTILHKRENMRKAFKNFDYKKIAKFTKDDIDKFMKNKGLIRNQMKIKAMINNAQKFLAVQKEFGSFSKYMWSFTNNQTIDGKRKTTEKIPSTSKEAKEFAKDLKKRGFKFIGPTTIYAHMQAVGMVNDHLTECFCYKRIKSNFHTNLDFVDK